MNPETKEITDKSDPKKQVRFYAIKSEIIPTKLDLSDGVQLIIYNPFNLIIKRIGTLLLGTLIIMLFIIVCLIYQTNLIFILKRILQLREDFTYALIHDMKSPLSTIFMTLNFLHSGRMDGKPEMMFNKFERGAASKRIRKGGAAGFGLGLSFVQQVVEAHQGNVFANSIENEFTEISIFLPNSREIEADK